MGATFSVQGRNVFGNKRAHFIIVTFDTAYPTGGYPVIGSNVDMVTFNGIQVLDVIHPTGYVVRFNQSTNRLMCYETPAAGGALTEIAAGTDVSSGGIALMAIGE